MTPRVGRRTLLAFGALALVAFGCSAGNEGNAEGLEPLTPLGTGGDPAGRRGVRLAADRRHDR